MSQSPSKLLRTATFLCFSFGGGVEDSGTKSPDVREEITEITSDLTGSHLRPALTRDRILRSKSSKKENRTLQRTRPLQLTPSLEVPWSHNKNKVPQREAVCSG